ncbi:hypothetical protein [Bdellovibrio sp. KM01]|uniref:hypothetical protein n=1 Tax=Bdellovibrio sp. KM01 TaxID=2748865 RepID=UPI0015EAFA70|nr:hypothetical protein [Bdellovibrio sp. KM01]QLY26872.1 hypothetical protein HW988_07715 [Bdellovibrio sp. KM01]
MKLATLIVISLMFLEGCSVYRSDGRNQFEAAAPAKINGASLVSPSSSSSSEIYTLTGCKNQSRLETWFNDEFPRANYELVVMENDLEIWRTTRPGTVEVKAIQRSDKNVQACSYEFSSLAVWDLYKEQFVRELENNLMISE